MLTRVEETRIFTCILKPNGFDHNMLFCQIGPVDMGVTSSPEELKILPGRFEAICNPLIQAGILNGASTSMW